MAKLTVRYGEAFMRQYADAEPAIVKADWAEVLDGFRGEDIGYALRYLPSERPPNAMQFRGICRRAPAATQAQLPAPVTPMPDAIRAKLAEMRSRMQRNPRFGAWAAGSALDAARDGAAVPREAIDAALQATGDLPTTSDDEALLSSRVTAT